VGARIVRRSAAFPTALALLVLATGCSMKRFVAGQVGSSIASGGDVFTRDDDPELVRDAIPFGLKTMESLLEIVPRHEKLLLAACQGFAQYGFAFVESEADEVAATDHARAEAMRARALGLYLRGLAYGLRGLEVRHKGIADRLRANPDAAVATLGRRDLPMLYWTAAAWGSAISVGRDRPEITADLAAVQAMMRRTLALDEDYEDGAVHEAMIVLEALPEFMGGSPERARTHFRRAVELSQGRKATPYVLLAGSVSVAKQDRAEFERLLRDAVAVDPDARPRSRLETIVMQRRAAMLLERADDLFLEPVPADADTVSPEESE
jgi:predicted anti-sigma-YlaC factor YlaD